MILQELGSDQVVTLRPSDSIDKAILLMEEHGIRHLPVVDGQRPIGMVSDRDLLAGVGGLSKAERISTTPGDATVGPQRVEQIMSTPVRTLAPSDSIAAALKLMTTEKISSVPLVTDEAIAGIVTETDCLRCFLDDRAVALGTGWRFEKIEDHMSPEVLALEPGDRLTTALKIMTRRQIRHLPVTEDGVLLGVVSDRDLLKAWFRDAMFTTSETETGGAHMQPPDMRLIMKRNVVTVRPGDTVTSGADLMLQYRIGCLPVVESERLVGIITETDLLHCIARAYEQ
ncbi:MAG: hypothetical protein CMJ18_23370 [Phycisphaeraceae bacterium]|nr:hypothetical protein [Phycisphaeraceae bacterium]